jgi:hypothetical protein
VTPLVLIILAVMWVLVLVPPLLRSRTDGRPSNSISTFQRQLRTLQRTGGAAPTRGSVTYLRGPAAARRSVAPRAVPTSRYVDVDDWYDGYDAHDAPHAPHSYPRAQAARPRSMRSPGYAAARRELVRRRRQNILLTLLATAFLSAVLGFGLKISLMVWVCLVSVVALALYVLLLIQARRAAELRAYRASWSRVAA